jgi:cytochrome c oxidase subunit 2
MTSLLVIIVLVLLAVALWQLTKIFDLLLGWSNSDSSQIATDDDNNVQGYLMFGFLALYIYFRYMVCLHGDHCSSSPASEHGSDVDNDEYYLGLDFYCCLPRFFYIIFIYRG